MENNNFTEKLIPISPHRDHFSEVNRMTTAEFPISSSIRKKNMVSNRQLSGKKSSSWIPESEDNDEEIPRIPRLCMMQNKDDIDMEEAKYDTEMLMLKSMTVSK